MTPTNFRKLAAILDGMDTGEWSARIVGGVAQAREGYCYTAAIYLGGKKVGTTHDAGRGGSLLIEIDAAARRALDTYLATLKDSRFSDVSAELFLGIVGEVAMELKHLGRIARTRTLWRDHGGKLMSMNTPWTPETSERMAQDPKMVEAGAVILNGFIAAEIAERKGAK